MRALPLGRGQVAGEQLHRGALAGAVGPEKGDDLSLGNAEGDVFDGGKIAIVLRQADGLDHGRPLRIAHRISALSQRTKNQQSAHRARRLATLVVCSAPRLSALVTAASNGRRDKHRPRDTDSEKWACRYEKDRRPDLPHAGRS